MNKIDKKSHQIMMQIMAIGLIILTDLIALSHDIFWGIMAVVINIIIVYGEIKLFKARRQTKEVKV